jgi:hypothetical protein
MELDLLKILPFISKDQVFWSPIFGNCKMFKSVVPGCIDLECIEPEIIKIVTICKNGKYLRTKKEKAIIRVLGIIENKFKTLHLWSTINTLWIIVLTIVILNLI